MYQSNPRYLGRQKYNFASSLSMYCDYGKGDSVPINQNPSKDFNVDPNTGRPMQEITALLRAQSAAEQMALFSGLEDFKGNYLPKDVSDEDAIKFMMPRYCQLPSQISEFVANLQTDRDIRKLQELKQKEDEKDDSASKPVESAAVAAGPAQSGTSSASE